MGNQQSTAPVSEERSGCPVKHEKQQQPTQEREGCPVQHDQATKQDSGCPVKHESTSSSGSTEPTPEVYNVYGQRIDPTNMMPYNPNQDPNDAQRYPLPQDRVQSTIPKGGTEGTWLYPSEQMFFNALRRKGKGEDVHEGDVAAIVAIHNNMNERAWAQVEHYESVCHPGSTPKLLKFCGRPDKLTPLAWVKQMLGYGTPFDRHDWTILRSDNTQARYVIDYYFDEEKSAEDEVPALHSAKSVKSISMYARPALDSVEAVVDRIKYPLVGVMQRFEAPDVAQRAKLIEPQAEERSKNPPLSVEEVESTFAKVKESCKKNLDNVKSCKSEIECSQAATALQLCMANIICPGEAAKFKKVLETGDDTQVEAAFESVSSCLEDFQERSATAMREQAMREAAARK